MNTNTPRANFLMPLLRIALHKRVQVLLGKNGHYQMLLSELDEQLASDCTILPFPLLGLQVPPLSTAV